MQAITLRSRRRHSSSGVQEEQWMPRAATLFLTPAVPSGLCKWHACPQPDNNHTCLGSDSRLVCSHSMYALPSPALGIATCPQYKGGDGDPYQLMSTSTYPHQSVGLHTTCMLLAVYLLDMSARHDKWLLLSITWCYATFYCCCQDVAYGLHSGLLPPASANLTLSLAQQMSDYSFKPLVLCYLHSCSSSSAKPPRRFKNTIGSCTPSWSSTAAAVLGQRFFSH